MFLAVTRPEAGEYCAFQPEVMVCPPGRVNSKDQPWLAVVPVLVRVMFEVRPLFQALTVSVTWQPAVPGGGLEVWNCVKNFHTSPGTQLREPLSPAAPSCGAAMCPSSNAAQATGYPAEHPE
ncbi:hypothetical protein GCM10027074_74280 [Streptomyces deserti]